MKYGLWLGPSLLAACILATAGCDGEMEVPDAPTDGGGPSSDVGTLPDASDDGGMPPECVEDMCGTCDLDPDNDCVQDCADEWGGTATEDGCGTCDADATNDCAADCAGEFGGAALADMCGTCDADPTNDCVADCAGEFGGSASIDACDTCDADPTNDCDCAGTAGGSATTDMCGTCDADLTNDCVMDCAGTFGGTATLDGCGTCDSDPTNDCPNDCDGVPGGPARLDMCGTCDADLTNDCVADCAGVFGGAAVRDMCTTCDADPTNDCTQDCADVWGGSATTDMCGTCDAIPANDCVADCSGAFGGTAVLDACGRCTGGTTGLTACPTLVLYPVADATVNEGSAGTNYGTSTTLEVSAASRGDDHRTFLRFDLSSLPAGSVVRGATLEAHAYQGYAYGGDGNVYTSFVADDTWGETSVNWSNQPTTDGMTYGFWWLWYNHTPSHKIGRNSNAALVPLIQREYDGDGLVSLRLHSPGYDTSYRSREYATTAERPSLTIGYMPSTTITLEAAADAWVDGSSTNHGTDATLRVERYTPAQTYVRFDLASIPAGAEVVEAELTMTAFDGYAYGSDGNVYVHRVGDDTWGEATIHGTNAPPFDPTALGFWWLWYDNVDRDQVGRLTGEPLRAAVATEANSDDALSLRLHSPGYDTRYRSREYATAAQRPTLRVRYVLP